MTQALLSDHPTLRNDLHSPAALTRDIIDPAVDDYCPRFDPLPFYHFRLTCCNHQDVTFIYLGKEGLTSEITWWNNNNKTKTQTKTNNLEVEQTKLCTTLFTATSCSVRAAHRLRRLFMGGARSHT